jgi:hypothetical protein
VCNWIRRVKDRASCPTGYAEPAPKPPPSLAERILAALDLSVALAQEIDTAPDLDVDTDRALLDRHRVATEALRLALRVTDTGIPAGSRANRSVGRMLPAPSADSVSDRGLDPLHGAYSDAMVLGRSADAEPGPN